MKIRRKRTRRLVSLTLLALVLSAATYAFAAANTFSAGAPAAGDGTSAAISGYDITAITYDLDDSDGLPSADNDGDPSDIDRVMLTTTPAANSAWVRLMGTVGAATYYPCTALAALPSATWNCPVNAETSGDSDVLGFSSLRVVAAG